MEKRGVSETNGSYKEKCDSRNLSLWDVYCAYLRFNWLGGLVTAEQNAHRFPSFLLRQFTCQIGIDCYLYIHTLFNDASPDNYKS